MMIRPVAEPKKLRPRNTLNGPNFMPVDFEGLPRDCKRIRGSVIIKNNMENSRLQDKESIRNLMNLGNWPEFERGKVALAALEDLVNDDSVIIDFQLRNSTPVERDDQVPLDIDGQRGERGSLANGENTDSDHGSRDERAESSEKPSSLRDVIQSVKDLLIL